MNKKLIFNILALTILVLTVSVTTALAASKSYNGVTTVTYNNRILEQGTCCWNGGFNDSTSPSRLMDTFGASVATTYITCDNEIDYATWASSSNVYQYNVSKVQDGAARTKTSCGGNKVRRLVAVMNHYWQDYPYTASGGQLITSLIK